MYGKGISFSGEVVDLGVNAGLIQKSGSWFSVGSERIGQGRDNARTYLEEHPDVMAQVERELLAQNQIVRFGEKSLPPVAAEGSADAEPEADAEEKGLNGAAKASRAAARRAARPN